MNLPYQFFIAGRYFRSKKRHRGISVNTLISIGGVALGVMTLITVLSVMSGFHQDLREKILGVNSHIVVMNFNGRIKDYRGLMEKLNGVSGVQASSPFIYGQVIIRNKDRAQGVVVRGVDPESGLSTIKILKNLKMGSVDSLEDADGLPGMIVGIELMRRLGVFIGDVVDVVSPVGEIGPLGMIPKMKKFRISGYFEAGMYEYDSSLAFISLRHAQEFFNYGDSVTGIEVRVNDIYRADSIAGDITSTLGPPFYARDWMQLNRNLFSALKLEKIVMFIILTLIVIVASFNIISNLIMIVIEKNREIAILKAMGATKRGIMSVFMIHGLIIGITGTIIGVIGGYILCYLLKTYKFISLPGDVYYLSYLPVKMNLFDFIVVPLAAILISFSATIYPAWQAARLDPVEPLRYE